MAGARSVTWVVPVLGLLACADALSYAVTITGAVVDAQGEPVTDATILVSYKKPGTLALARAKADNEGRFTVEFEPSKDAVLPTWRVGAFSPRHALEWQDVADGQSCTLRLTRKPVPCRGVVVDEEGKGVPRAEVGVDWIMWGEGIANWFYVRGLPELTRTTDAEGRFEVPGVPPNSRLSLHVVAPGKATKQERFNSARPQVLRIQLAPEARIRGKLTHKGKPVGGVEVFCQAQGAGVGWDDATTDADGSYVLEHLPAGTYNVMVNPPEGLTAVAVEGVTVQAGDETTARDLELIEGGYVEGTVTEADTGEPTEGAHIGAYGPARPDSSAATQSVKTDAEGRYRIVLPPGKNRVYYAGGVTGRSRAEPPNVDVDVKQGETTQAIDFALLADPKIELSVTVLGADGKPAEGVLVSASFPGSAHVVERKTDADGRAVLKPDSFEARQIMERLETCAIVVLARDSKRGLAEAAVVDNMDEPVQMQLTQGGYLVGRVEDLAGKPLGGVGVQALIVTGGGDAEDCLRANSSDGGEFRLGPLPAGRPLRVSSYQAYLMAVDWPWADLGNVILGPGDELELPVLVLKPEGESIEGRVLGPDGAPVAGAAVAASESVSGDAPHTTTDTDGRFRLTRLRTRGDVWLLAFLPERDLYAAVQVAADVAFAPDIVLAPLGKANGSIFKAGGEALANTKIMVWPPGLQAFGLADLGLPRNITKMGPEAQTVETDADGGWEVEDLVAGMEYEIAVAAPDHPHAFRRISSFEAAGGEVVEVGDTFLDQ